MGANRAQAIKLNKEKMYKSATPRSAALVGAGATIPHVRDEQSLKAGNKKII